MKTGRFQMAPRLDSGQSSRRGRGEAEMTKYLAGVLSVIAVGVLLVAYGLLNPRASMDASTIGMAPFARSATMTEPVAMRDAYGNIVYVPLSQAQGLAQQAAFVPVNYVPQQAFAPASAPVTFVQPASNAGAAPRAVRTVSYEPSATRRATTRTQEVERTSGRDWKRTALIIGGSSATGAGVGAIFGGKKGALIGAAIGGGASTIYQTMK